MRHRAPRPTTPRETEIVIETLGAQGDGLAVSPLGRLYVPFAVPGDRLRVRLGAARGDGCAAEALELLEPGPGRAEPPCPHYGDCGGCSAQHMTAELYRDWKRRLVVEALARRGLGDVPVSPLIAVPPGRRRRVALAALRLKDRSLIGFNARQSRRVVDVTRCLHLEPELDGLIAPLRKLLAETAQPGTAGDAIANRVEGAIDLLLTWPMTLDLATRERLAAFAQAHDLARLSVQPPDGLPEPVAMRRPVIFHVGGVAVDVPPGAFLQPSAEGEAALVAEVLAAVGSPRRLADLFAGCGTFALALAASGASVHAVEGSQPAVHALEGAVARAGWNDRVTVARRDLDRRPLLGPDLKNLDAVVFDPPRAGAKAQAEALADSSVPVVVAVSCAPSTFARDARILVNGGYRLTHVVPVDQFPYTAHLELVGVFRRGA